MLHHHDNHDVRRPRSTTFRAPAMVGAILLLGAFAAAGCGSGGDATPTGPAAEPPVALADVEILDNESTNPDPASYVTCQTGAGVRLKAFNASGGSYDPSGQELTYEWLDAVDQGEGIQPSVDFFPESNPRSTDQPVLTANLYTIGVHYLTLTVRTRDGRKASQTLRVTVTACENCGG